MKKRRNQPREERRTAQVELNLMAENEGGSGINKTRRGCALPFLGGVSLFLIALEAVRSGLG
jgi:hypothetical protein